jgi:hypothetical protein
MANAKGESIPLPDPSDTTATTGERRRTGRIVHDDRGNGRVEWVDVPPGYERTTLSLEETHPVYRPDHGYDPYTKGAHGDSRKAPAVGSPAAPAAPAKPAPSAAPAKPAAAAAPAGPRPRRDLRKLSEWIKQMRQLEERKREEGDDQT